MASNDERQVYIDEMVAKRGYVLDYHKYMATQDWKVLKAANGLIEACYLSDRSLDRKTKELLFVLSLVVLRSTKVHIKSHIEAALRHGASATEVLEAIEICLPEAGVVAFQHGFECWKEVVQPEGLEPSAPPASQTSD